MPKVGMEPIRRIALVAATIDEIGQAGTLDVTVSQIARRAGVSSALAHHYFGSKENILLAAMRYILTAFGHEAREALATDLPPRERLAAILQVCFSSTSYRPEVASAWLNFYVLAQTSVQAKRLLHIYHARLHSNLVYALRPIAGSAAVSVAQSTSALIDGLYIRQVLQHAPLDRADVIQALNDHVDAALSAQGRTH